MSVILKLHWPHNRLALGWDIYYPDEEHDTNMIVLYLFIATLEIEF